MSASSRLSPRYRRIRTSVAGELARSYDALARAGRPVINLAHGFIPGDLPRELRQVAMDSWRDGHFTYVGGPGLPALRDAVVEWLDMRECRTADDVLVSPGCRAATANVLAVIAGPGDTVLIDGAAWMIFHQLVSVSGATPVPCLPSGGTGRRLKLQPEDVRLALEMMQGARALLLCNPVNPTGQVYTADEIHALVDVCAAAGVFCIIDRLQGKLVYDGGRFPYLRATPAVRDWCVIVDGVTRAFRGMGGLHIGWACGPRDLVEAAGTAQEHGSGPASRVLQRVALAALQSPWDLGLLEELQTSRDVLLEQLTMLPDVDVWPVEGTLYCLLDMSAWIGRTTPIGWVLESSGDIADYLLNEAHVLVMPGDIAGHRGFVRLAFGHAPHVIVEAVGRMRWALGHLRKGG